MCRIQTLSDVSLANAYDESVGSPICLRGKRMQERAAAKFDGSAGSGQQRVSAAMVDKALDGGVALDRSAAPGALPLRRFPAAVCPWARHPYGDAALRVHALAEVIASTLIGRPS